MNVLIVKLGATGDVVRTTPLLHRLSGSVTWITAAKNGVLLDGLSDNLRHFSWEARARALDIPYDLAINLEDTLEVAQFLKSVRPAEIFGAHADLSKNLCYTDNSKCWFDLSLISSHGRHHCCLVGGDSLPMHLALGTATRCVTLFTCTSPWEIYDYGIQKKIVSPVLAEFFYKRGYDERATTAITVDEVFNAVMTLLRATVGAAT